MQTSIDPAPYVEQIKRALGAKAADLDEADIRDELQKYLDYGVPADQAVRTILRHHGAAPAARPAGAAPTAPVSQERIPLASLPPQSPFVNLKARLLSLNTKPVMARGEQKEIVWGLLGDETGTAPYTSWRPLEGLQKGDVLSIEGAYTKAYNSQAQVNFGDRTKITKLAAEDLPKTPTVFRDTPIAELKEGLRGIRVTGRVLEVAPRQVTVQGQPKTVWGGSLADATGKVEFSAWSDPKLAAGQAVTIEGGYVRAYRGVPQLNFDADARITPAAQELPDAAALDVRAPTLLRDLLARGGGSDVQVVATLLEVKEGSGLVLRCPTPGCTRVLAAGTCRIHNKVEGGVPDLRVKAVLDDGTGAVQLIVGRELTEQLLGKDLERAKKEAQDAFRPDLIRDQLRDRLTSRVFAVRGNALSDEYGMTFIARSVKPHADDKAAAAQAILTALEAA
jgi:replication factor A1